jgi:hemerythrin-like domain-containing protein
MLTKGGLMNITQALVDHHGVLRQLFEQSKTNIAVADEFLRNLIVHHTMEEKYFYDFLEKELQARKMALEGVNEHHIIEMIIKDLERFPRDHERFAIKVESLGEYTTHHLDEEEQKIFPTAEQLFPLENQATLGNLFTQAKSMLLGIKLPPVPGMAGSKAAKAIVGAKKKEPPPKAAATESRTLPPDLGIGSLKK